MRQQVDNKRNCQPRALDDRLADKDIRVNYTVNPSGSVSQAALAVAILDRFLFFIEPVIDYAFGIFMGYALGWITGLWAGLIYVKHYEPVSIETINEVFQWRLTPYEFAKYGAIIGIVAGIIVIKLINSSFCSGKATSS